MKNSDFYYQYYDTFHQDKNYEKETDLILSQVRQRGISRPKKILEIGCGTGCWSIPKYINVSQTTNQVRQNRSKCLKTIDRFNNLVSN